MTTNSEASGMTSDETSSNGSSAPGKEALRDLVERIVAAVEPERILLFGSAARGDMGPHSDLDVLVVKSGDYRRIDVLHVIRRALRGFPFAVDLVVARPSELKRYSESRSLVYYPAVKEGRELYAA